jgi:hypothetical protein
MQNTRESRRQNGKIGQGRLVSLMDWAQAVQRALVMRSCDPALPPARVLPEPT